MRILRDFYIQKTLKVAKDMLGKFIVRKIGRETRAGMIVETEAYIGPQDRASHALGGKRTPRNKAEYLIGGHIYIYLVYGMYWQLNISTGGAGEPECVLIRALQPVLDGNKISNFQFPIGFPIGQPNKKYYCSCPLKALNGRFQRNQFSNSKFSNSKKIINLANGPGKLCHWLYVNKSFYAEDVTKSKKIWLEDQGMKIKKSDIVASPRIGIDYAGPIWSKKPWRFYIKNNLFVSKL